MERVFKYKLKVVDNQEIEMPNDSCILHVGVQHGIPCIWALVNEGNDPQVRVIDIFGTGHPIEDDYKGKHLGTFLIHDDLLVFHVFEREGRR